MNDFKFDHTKDYYKELRDDELWDGKFPLLRGLARLAHERGIKRLTSDVIAVPTKDSPIAAVTVQVEFFDGTVFSGSADAKFKAHEPPFNRHLTALADSKAEARAYRRAFNITMASHEECGDMTAGGDVDKTPIADSQIQGIKNMAELRNLTMAQAINLVFNGEDRSIEKLTSKQGRDIIKALNKYKPKKNVTRKRTAEATG